MVFARRRTRHRFVGPGSCWESNVAARALRTAPPGQMWLPRLELNEDESDRQSDSEMPPVEAWISHLWAELKIDEDDPYGCREAVQRARPSRHIIRAFQISADQPWADIWRDRAERAVFLSLAWGEKKGQGKHGTSDSGSALQCERVFLSELLSVLDRNLIVLVKLQHYREHRRWAATKDEDGGPFTYAYSVFSISRDLLVGHVVPTQHDLDLIRSLGERTGSEFRHRLRVLTAVHR